MQLARTDSSVNRPEQIAWLKATIDTPQEGSIQRRLTRFFRRLCGLCKSQGGEPDGSKRETPQETSQGISHGGQGGSQMGVGKAQKHRVLRAFRATFWQLSVGMLPSVSYRFVALLLACFSFAACKPKSEPEPEPEPAAPVESAPLTSKQEEAITKDFITRFLDVIDADDVKRWPEMLTKERAERYQQEGIIEEVYAAWHQGTASITDRLRKAPFRLDPGVPTRILHFEGVNVATDPNMGYMMEVRIIDGKMYVDED